MVELPELNEEQRLYLQTIFEYFHREGKWPTYLWVENTIRAKYPTIWPDFDMAKVCKSLPDGFANGFSFIHQYGQEAVLIAPVLSYFPEAKEEIDDFIRVLRFFVEIINTSDEERPTVSSEDISSQLHMQPLAVRKMGLLFLSEGDIANGSGANNGWWQITLKRGIDGVRRFAGVESFEQYLKRRSGLTHYFSNNVLVQPDLSELTNEVPTSASRKVFIVHGHDIGARDRVANFLRQLGLQPIILVEQPNAGQTIIEKFETHSEVGFAVVLLTPDDLGTSKDNPHDLKPRARQNAIFELGYFVGTLGRSRVCCLSKGGIETPSDYYGVVFLPMDEGEWRFQLAKELKQVFEDIDLNKLMES